MWQKSGSRDYLVPAKNDLQTACTKFRATSNSQAWLGSQHELTRTYVTAWEKYNIPLNPVLEELQKLESIADAEWPVGLVAKAKFCIHQNQW